MNKFNTQDIIRYVDGEMDTEERKSFEAEILLDLELKTETKLYQSVKATLKADLGSDAKDQAFKANLKEINQKHFAKNQKKTGAKIIAFSKVWYAAAVLVIGLLIWAPWNTNLYDKYADTQMVSFAERGNNDTQNLQQATDAFNAGKYTDATNILAPLLEKKPEDDMLRFYFAVAELENNKVAVARENLSEVYAGESVFKYDAAFYIALSYLKQKNKEECKVWLAKIPADTDVYAKAQKLLKDL